MIYIYLCRRLSILVNLLIDIKKRMFKKKIVCLEQKESLIYKYIWGVQNSKFKHQTFSKHNKSPIKYPKI